MKCKIISISHKLSDWEKQALQFYSKQLPSHFKISHAEVRPSSSKYLDKESILEAERLEIIKNIDNDSNVILWDRKGQKINSHGFATLLQDKIDHGININFIIGGIIPTKNPTLLTISPTFDTKLPTNSPSISPTNNPSTTPTIAPSNAPTIAPTNAPTIRPTISPTYKPSLIPTSIPSNIPTESPL